MKKLMLGLMVAFAANVAMAEVISGVRLAVLSLEIRGAENMIQ